MTVTAANNPFRMRRIEALGYRPHGQTWDELLALMASAGYRGAVVGPHGSGKTTLLADLAIRLRRRGERVVELFTNRDHGRALPPDWRDALRTRGGGAIVLADGYDTLGLVARAAVRRGVTRLIVTAHRPCALTTLVRTGSRPDVLREIVHTLRGRGMSLEEAERRLADHGRNMRDALRAMYDEAT